MKFELMKNIITDIIKKVSTFNFLIVQGFTFLLFIPAIPFVIFIRILSPFFIVRMHGLISSRIGHLAANTEIYLCEKKAGINVPDRMYIDIFYPRYMPICNKYLLNKWSDIIFILPKWFVHPIWWMNQLLPGGRIHNIGDNTQSDRDVHNLFLT